MERYVIHVTKICNLRCAYCYEKDKTSTYTWEEVKQVIDSICKYNKEFGVEFLGGEPMLAFDLIKKSVEYLESKEDVNVDNYVITTNGTVLTDEAIEFFVANPKIHFAVSLDGGYFANQLRITKDNRNSYDLAIQNIRKLHERGLTPSTHIVSHPYNVGLLAKSVDLFYQENIRHIAIGIVESTMTIDDMFCKEWVKQMKAISKSIKEGKYPDLVISELEGLKPLDDQRYYIKDETGKVVAESYGRAKGDITSTEEYNSVAVNSKIGKMIDALRFEVYHYHQN